MTALIAVTAAHPTQMEMGLNLDVFKTHSAAVPSG